MTDEATKDLTKEKSLYDLYKLLRKIPQKRSSNVCIGLAFLVLLLHSTLFDVSDTYLVATTRSWAAFWLAAAVNILGFLIAAFTIFATLAKPDMLLAMQRMSHDCGMTVLKYNLVSFIGGIVYYFLYILYCWSVITVGAPGGFASLIINNYGNPILTRTVLIAAYVFTGGGAFLTLWMLKSYIFNVYTIIMNNLRWESRSRRSGK